MYTCLERSVEEKQRHSLHLVGTTVYEILQVDKNEYLYGRNFGN
jgi:hypothetical protein